MSGQQLFIGIGIGVFVALMGLSALLDGIDEFTHAHTLRAIAIAAFGVVLILGGIGLVSYLLAKAT